MRDTAPPEPFQWDFSIPSSAVCSPEEESEEERKQGVCKRVGRALSTSSSSGAAGGVDEAEQSSERTELDMDEEVLLEGRDLGSPINWLVSLIKHTVGVALEKSPSRVRKSSDSPDRLSNATESRYRGSNATKVALERL